MIQGCRDDDSYELPIDDVVSLLEVKVEALGVAMGLLLERMRLGHDTIPAGAALDLIELGMGEGASSRLRATLGGPPGGTFAPIEVGAAAYA